LINPTFDRNVTAVNGIVLVVIAIAALLFIVILAMVAIGSSSYDS